MKKMTTKAGAARGAKQEKATREDKLDPKSKEGREYLRDRACEIVRLEKEFVSLAAMLGMTKAEMMEKICSVIVNFNEGELGCLMFLIEGKVEALKLSKLGYTREEIQEAVDKESEGQEKKRQ